MRLRPCLLLTAVLLAAPALSLQPAEGPALLPLDQVRPGMQGAAYTIFQGDQVEKVRLTVVGVLHNALGPKQDVILVKLEGPEVEKTGVVAGMSGSPVYIDGKLAGALSLKLGIFTKEAIAGVTPIANMLDIENALPGPSRGIPARATEVAGPLEATSIPLPNAIARQVGLSSGQYLVSIDTPLIFSGLYPESLAQYSTELAPYGMSLMAGGIVRPQSGDARIEPGDMVGMSLISGDLSLSAGCTVTTIIEGRVFICGHPLFGFGSVELPMTRAHVVMTLASALESTKIMNTGGVIGTVTQDRLTGVMGRLDAGPQMIPLDVAVTTPTEEKSFHFQVVENAKLTPLLVGLATFNGIVGNTAYTEGSTLELSGSIELKGHPSVSLEDMFPPNDSTAPEGIFVAREIQNTFARIFTNPFEPPHIERISLRVTSVPAWRAATIESVWSDRNEAAPGDTLHVKVLLRPYRGAPFIQEVPITIPPQAARGNLQILVSDSETLNRMRQFFPGGPSEELQGLDELIGLLNRERRNDRLYVTLLQQAPTLLIQDKELPNVPGSEINVLDHHSPLGGARLLWQSAIGESAVDMHQVISGDQYLTVTVK